MTYGDVFFVVHCCRAVGSDSLHRDLTTDPRDASHVTGGELTSGGRWRPSWCVARHRVAILVPYRKRERDLLTLLKVLHCVLRRQLIDYTIFVVEQVRVCLRNSLELWRTLTLIERQK